MNSLNRDAVILDVLSKGTDGIQDSRADALAAGGRYISEKQIFSS